MPDQRHPRKKLVSGHLFPEEIESLRHIAESKGLTVTGLFRAIALEEIKLCESQPDPAPWREREMAGK